MRAVKLLVILVMLVSLLGCMTVEETEQRSEVVAEIAAKEMLEAMCEYEVIMKTDLMKQTTTIYLQRRR